MKFSIHKTREITRNKYKGWMENIKTVYNFSVDEINKEGAYIISCELKYYEHELKQEEVNLFSSYFYPDFNWDDYYLNEAKRQTKIQFLLIPDGKVKNITAPGLAKNLEEIYKSSKSPSLLAWEEINKGYYKFAISDSTLMQDLQSLFISLPDVKIEQGVESQFGAEYMKVKNVGADYIELFSKKKLTERNVIISRKTGLLKSSNTLIIKNLKLKKYPDSITQSEVIFLKLFDGHYFPAGNTSLDGDKKTATARIKIIAKDKKNSTFIFTQFSSDLLKNSKAIKTQFTLDKQKQYVINLELNRGTEFNLEFDNKKLPLFIEPGDDLVLDLSQRNLHFYNIGAGNNTYLNSQPTSSPRKNNPDPVLHRNKLDSTLKSSLSTLEKNRINLTLDFYHHMQCKLIYGFAKNIVTDKNYLEVKRPTILDSIFLSNNNAAGSKEYYEFLDTYIPTILDKNIRMVTGIAEINLDELNKRYEKYYDLGFYYLLPPVSEIYCAKIVVKQLTSSFEKGEKLYFHYLENFPNSSVLEYLTFQYNKFQLTKNNNIAPNFTLKDLNGKEVSLSDYIGKVVYLDFWASNCPPCLMEYDKSFPRLKKSMENKDVVFINISLDLNPDTWKKTISRLNIEGINLMDKGYASDVVQKYNIKALPTYFIIDRTGKIFRNNTLRPSNPALISELEKALDNYSIK